MLKSYFFDSVNGNRKYNARDFTEIFNAIIPNGVFREIGDQFVVKPKSSSGMWITVGTGQAWFNNIKVNNTTKIEIEVPPSITQNNTNAVILEINHKELGCYIYLMENYEKSKLVNDDFLHQYAIATITVPLGAINISESNIKNLIGTDIPYIDMGGKPSLSIMKKNIGSASSWNRGSLPTLGANISAASISSFDKGTLPTLGTSKSASNISSWNAGSQTSASISKGVLKISVGSLPTLNYSNVSIPNVTSVGSLPTLNYSNVSIPNVTSVGSLPSLTITNEEVVVDAII